VDRGKFRWDQRVVDLDPDWQLKDPWVTQEFRMFDLLAQRSGLPSYVNDMLSFFGLDEVGLIRQFYQWVTAFRIGVSPARVIDAQDQDQAWGRDIPCLRDQDIQTVKTVAETNYTIELVACPSGDILLTLTPLQNPNHKVTKWIITRNFFTEVAGFAVIAPAMALDHTAVLAQATPVRVIDAVKQGTTVIRRIQRSDNTCVDETIDAYTGRLLDQKNAPCAQFGGH
jgi:hypothetical protein